MKTAPIFPSGYLDALAEDFFPRHHRTDLEAQVAFPLQLVGFTAVLGTHLLCYGARSIVRRLRARNMLPPAPKPAKSLRGVPSPEDLRDAWYADPRTLSARLVIGSRLADLEPTLDNRFIFKTNRAGRRRIAARQPGLKGWLRTNAPDIKYSTSMHYKKLATRIRQLIGLDTRIPVEWLLSSSEEGARRIADLPPPDRKAIATAQSKLRRLLADYPKYTDLARTVEQKLGIMRMVTIRRIQPPKPGRGNRRKPKKTTDNSLVSRIRMDGWSTSVDTARSEAFWDAIRKVLGEQNPDSATRRLQSDIRDWLNAPLQARRNRRR